MTATASAVEAWKRARVLGLPRLPIPGTYCEGWEWMEKLGLLRQPKTGRWVPLPDWGSEGWTLGNWPYVVVAVTRVRGPVLRPDFFASIVYVEGDLELRTAETYEEWVEQIGRTAHFYWKHHRGPKVDPEFERCGPELRQPYYDGGFPRGVH